MDTRLIALIKIHVTRLDIADGEHRQRVRVSLLQLAYARATKRSESLPERIRSVLNKSSEKFVYICRVSFTFSKLNKEKLRFLLSLLIF